MAFSPNGRTLAWGTIDGNVVLQRAKKQEYVAWDTAATAVRYRLNQESFRAPLAKLSSGRRQLVLPGDKFIQIHEAYEVLRDPNRRKQYDLKRAG